jgi:hypothetical protein
MPEIVMHLSREDLEFLGIKKLSEQQRAAELRRICIERKPAHKWEYLVRKNFRTGNYEEAKS